MRERLIVAICSFAATIGLIFISDRTRPEEVEFNSNPYADILRAVSSPESAIITALPAARPIVTFHPAPIIPVPSPAPISITPVPYATPTSTTPAAPALIIPNSSATPTPLPTTLPIQTTPAPTLILPPPPSPLQSPAPTTIPAGHIFYTSSRSNSTKYYCDTDSAWKDLSPTYLKQFNSEAELLAAYPGKVLSKPCK